MCCLWQAAQLQHPLAYGLGSEAVPAALRAIGEKLFANAPLTEAEQQALKEFYAGQDEAVDGAAGTGYDGENKVVRRRTAGYTYVSQPLLEKCGCTREDLTAYLANTAGVDAAELYYRTDLWPQEIQVPKDPSVLGPGRGIDWAPARENGYVLDKNGNPIRKTYVPQIGEILDRFGSPKGRFVSPVVDGKPYTYDQRALPYLEDPRQYHQYEVIGDFSNLEHYVEICPDREFVQKIQKYINLYYDKDYKNVVTYTGEIAGVEGWGSGGGIQDELPFYVEWLEALGLLREI